MPATKATLEPGSLAPAFALADENGKLHRLSDYRGKTVILYFYPKDNTPGCTVEACDFRDRHADFLKKGAVVLGVSPDAAKAHLGFKAKHGLPFPLLVDEGHAAALAYGVWKEKSLYGRRFMGIERSTFVIGPDGRLQQVLRKVSVAGHAQALLGGI